MFLNTSQNLNECKCLWGVNLLVTPQKITEAVLFRNMLKWLKTFSITAMHSLNFLCKIAPMAKFICASFLIFETLDISTIFTKDKPCRR